MKKLETFVLNKALESLFKIDIEELDKFIPASNIHDLIITRIMTHVWDAEGYIKAVIEMSED